MTDSKRDDILRKVRGLYAKAQSTEFEGERQVFMAKADQMMESYAIETWMLEAGKDAEQARLIETRVMDMDWWNELSGVPWDTRVYVWHLFSACVKHCRCYTSWSAVEYKAGGQKVTVYGMSADIDYLNFLFTDLFVQLFGKIQPSYDPQKSMGHNVMIAKEAGMKYTDIAIWLGHPEWRIRNGTGGYKTDDKGKMLREYKAYLKSIGKTTADVVKVHPTAWSYSFVAAFYSTITRRFREMSDERDSANSGGAELVLRDIRNMAMDAYYNDHGDERPHPVDCPCERCVKARKNAKAVTRSSRGRSGPQVVAAGYAAGGTAGNNARIASRAGKLGGTKQLGE